MTIEKLKNKLKHKKEKYKRNKVFFQSIINKMKQEIAQNTTLIESICEIMQIPKSQE